jgi:hypothetical protein
MTFDVLKDEYSIFKFNQNFPVNENLFGGEFISITKTRDETSVVAASSASDDYEKIEEGWKILKINEILDFGLTGILSKISAILAEEKIGIFVISTYNTDYILIKKENVKNAISKLEENNYEIGNNGAQPKAHG